MRGSIVVPASKILAVIKGVSIVWSASPNIMQNDKSYRLRSFGDVVLSVMLVDFHIYTILTACMLLLLIVTVDGADALR